MKRTMLFWVLAFVITIAAAIYQRMTGPTYPVKGTEQVASSTVTYRLLRSHEVDEDAPAEIQAPDTLVRGILEWKRFKTHDAWTAVPMERQGSVLRGVLPRQPAAGKLEYRVRLSAGGGAESVVPGGGEVVLRFKGVVPLAVLIVHVLAMFSAMLLATRTGLEFFNPAPNLARLIGWTIGVLAVGGLVLGPIVQKYAFDAYWTGWPFGHDLTDNKTILALLGWVAAAVAVRRSSHPRAWALGAAVLMFVVYMIPHSVLGSELDYAKMDAEQQTQEHPAP